MSPIVVELQEVSKAYGAIAALVRADLAAHEGELLSLLGPSGCGQTTTLNVIAGFVPPGGGRVLIDGAVFQSYALFPPSRSTSSPTRFFSPRAEPRRRQLEQRLRQDRGEERNTTGERTKIAPPMRSAPPRSAAKQAAAVVHPPFMNCTGGSRR